MVIAVRVLIGIIFCSNKWNQVRKIVLGGFSGFLKAVCVCFSKAKCLGKVVQVKESEAKAKCVRSITRAFSTIQETRIQTAYTSLLVTQILCSTALLFVF